MAPASIAAPKSAKQDEAQARQFWPLALGAVGVVYGDIGTSPIYAFREAVVAATGEAVVAHNTVLGILSLIVWSLFLLVTLKYVFVLLRADFNGEGGTFALMALAQSVAQRSKHVILILGIAGASFLYGDAAITPALSVISAVEGLKVIAPAFDKAVVPLSIVILIGLFAMQSRGTAKVAALFGPIIVLWFAVLAVIGVICIAEEPRVLAAFNPAYGANFLLHSGLIGLTVLGLVFLAVTGAEALYADLGHFGRKPIQAAWLGLGAARAHTQLPGTGRTRARPAGSHREPLLPHVPELGAVAGRAAHDGGDGDRQPGRDHRRLFHHPAGHPARASSRAWGFATRRKRWPARSTCRASTGCCCSPCCSWSPSSRAPARWPQPMALP